MLNEKSPGSVWNVAVIAIALFVAVITLAGTVQPIEIKTVAADAN